MDDRRRSRRGRPDNSRPESQVHAAPNPPPSSTPAWGEHIGAINMSQPQNMVNAPGGGGTVVNVTINRDGETPSTTNDQHDLHDSARTARADHEIYSNQLLTKKRGYPLWVPGPGMQLPIEYRRQGISIGDVGIITSTGEFDFLFNIFRPAAHPINRGVVPRGFSPLSLEDLVCDIQRTTVYGPNTYLASSSVRQISINWISETSIDQRFESTSKEAAILMMPDGATTQNLLNTGGVRSTISSNAKEWYTYARDTRGRYVKNGDIRVVVGFDKVASWGIAISSCNTSQTASYVFKHDPTHVYMWDCIGGSGRVGPQMSEISDLMEDNVFPQNQCVFVRTMNFTLSGRIWNDFPSDAVQQLEPGRRDSALGNRGRTRGRRGSSRRGSGRGNPPSSYQPGSIQGASSCIPSVNFDPVELGANHPSAALHSYLHEKFPDANMVITEDMDWISVLIADDIVFPEPEDLCARILDTHELRSNRGIIHLLKKDDPASRSRTFIPNVTPGDTSKYGACRSPSRTPRRQRRDYVPGPPPIRVVSHSAPLSLHGPMPAQAQPGPTPVIDGPLRPGFVPQTITDSNSISTPIWQSGALPSPPHVVPIVPYHGPTPVIECSLPPGFVPETITDANSISTPIWQSGALPGIVFQQPLQVVPPIVPYPQPSLVTELGVLTVPPSMPMTAPSTPRSSPSPPRRKRLPSGYPLTDPPPIIMPQGSPPRDSRTRSRNSDRSSITTLPMYPAPSSIRVPSVNIQKPHRSRSSSYSPRHRSFSPSYGRRSPPYERDRAFDREPHDCEPPYEQDKRYGRPGYSPTRDINFSRSHRLRRVSRSSSGHYSPTIPYAPIGQPPLDRHSPRSSPHVKAIDIPQRRGPERSLSPVGPILLNLSPSEYEDYRGRHPMRRPSNSLHILPPISPPSRHTSPPTMDESFLEFQRSSTTPPPDRSPKLITALEGVAELRSRDLSKSSSGHYSPTISYAPIGQPPFGNHPRRRPERSSSPVGPIPRGLSPSEYQRAYTILRPPQKPISRFEGVADGREQRPAKESGVPAELAKYRRESGYRLREDEGMQTLLNCEAQRNEEARYRTDAIWRDLEERLTALLPVFVAEGKPETLEDKAEIGLAPQQSAARTAGDVMGVIRLARDKFTREHELLAEQRAAFFDQLREERENIIEEKNARICALEKELQQLSGRLQFEGQRHRQKQGAQELAKEMEMAKLLSYKNLLAEVTRVPGLDL